LLVARTSYLIIIITNNNLCPKRDSNSQGYYSNGF
jgi:hypothetical protein